MTAVLEQPASVVEENGTARANADEGARAPGPEQIVLPPAPTRPTLPEGTAIIGYEVSWNTTGLLINRTSLSQLLAAAGFAEAMPKRRPTEKRALRRAITEWAELKTGEVYRSDDEDPDDRAAVRRRKKLIRQIEGAEAVDDGVVAPTVLALVQELSLGSRLELKYATSYRFSLTPPAGQETEYRLRVSTAARGAMDNWEDREEERQRVDAAIRPLWDKHKDLYTGGDVSTMLREIVHGLNGISVESGSGVYFIPVEYEGAVDRMGRFVQALAEYKETGQRPHFRARENIDWPRTRAALQEAALDQVIAEMRQAEAEVERFERQAADKPGSVKPSTARGVVMELIRIKQKAQYYEDTVGLRQGRLGGDLKGLGQRARALVGGARTTREERLGGDERALVVVATGERQARATRD